MLNAWEFPGVALYPARAKSCICHSTSALSIQPDRWTENIDRGSIQRQRPVGNQVAGEQIRQMTT
jgi:hypothetical protein